MRKHISRDCKCKFISKICNSNQKMSTVTIKSDGKIVR